MFGDTRSFQNSCGMAHLSIDFEIMPKRLFVLKKEKKYASLKRKRRYISVFILLQQNDCKLLLFLLHNKSCSSNPSVENLL